MINISTDLFAVFFITNCATLLVTRSVYFLMAPSEILSKYDHRGLGKVGYEGFFMWNVDQNKT